MSDAVELDGLAQLQDRLAAASAGLLDLSPANRVMASTVDRAASALVPRRSGRLAGTGAVAVGPDGWTMTYGAPYAAFVHWGTRYMRARPWLAEAVNRTEEEWSAQLAHHVQGLLDGN